MQQPPRCSIHGRRKTKRTEYDVTAYVCPACRADRDRAREDEDTVATDDGDGGTESDRRYCGCKATTTTITTGEGDREICVECGGIIVGDLRTDGGHRDAIQQKYQLDDPDIRIKLTCQHCGARCRHLVRHGDDNESTTTVCTSCGHQHTYPARMAATRLASLDTGHNNHVPRGDSA